MYASTISQHSINLLYSLLQHWEPERLQRFVKMCGLNRWPCGPLTLPKHWKRHHTHADSWKDRKERLQEDGKESLYKNKNGVMVKSFQFRKRIQAVLNKMSFPSNRKGATFLYLPKLLSLNPSILLSLLKQVLVYTNHYKIFYINIRRVNQAQTFLAAQACQKHIDSNLIRFTLFGWLNLFKTQFWDSFEVLFLKQQGI